MGEGSKALVNKATLVPTGARSAPGNPGGGKSGAASGMGGRDVSRADGHTPARTYAIRGREEVDASDVITGTFLILNAPVFTSIDPGSILSYILVVSWKIRVGNQLRRTSISLF